MRTSPATGWTHRLVEAARRVLLVVDDDARVHHRRHRHAGVAQSRHELVAVGGRERGRELLVDGVVPRPGDPPRRRTRVARPRRVTEHAAQGGPLLVGLHREREPAVAVADAVDVLGRGEAAPIALAAQQLAGGAVHRDLFRGDVQGRLHQRRLDHHALAGPVAVLERGQQGEHRVQATQRVARAAGHDRRAFLVSGDPGQPGDLLHRLGEPGPVAPRAVEAPRRHAQDDQAGIGAPQIVVEQPEALDDARRVVLDQDVARGQQPARQREALGLGEVEGHVALVGVRAVEQGRELPRPVPHRRVRGAHAGAVRALHRLDLHHVGAQEAEDLRRVRSGPVRREVEHPQARQRPGGVAGFAGVGLAGDARVRSVRAQCLGVGAERRHRAERAGRRATQAVGHAGLHHGPVGVLDEHLAFDERREAGQRLAVAQRRDRDPPFTRQVQHLVGGVRGRERGDLGPEHPVVLAPAVDPAELRMVGPFRVAHHLREGAELRRAVGREADPAVGGRLDRRHVDEAADRLRLRPAAVELRRHRLELVERDRHRLERRHVDERARVRCAAPRAARPARRRRRPCPRPTRRCGHRWRPAVRASDRGWRSSRTRPAA